jgi:putative membrane protein
MLLKTRIPLSFILGSIKYDILFIAIVAGAALYLTAAFEQFLPEVPSSFAAFLGTAISILLSFKLSQSYDRWWEARKVWGSIVNDSRSFVMQLLNFVNQGNEETIKKIAYRQIAWCYALGQSLRGEDPMKNMENYLTKDDLDAIRLHNNKPLALLHFHASALRALKDANQLDIFAHVHLDSTLTRLCEAQGKSERIKNTVFPVTYQMFLHFMIYMFVIVLSFSLPGFGSPEVVILLLISTPFFLLEKSAAHLQDPFANKPTDTAVTSIARTVEINIRQLLKESHVPEPIRPNGFYIS